MITDYDYPNSDHDGLYLHCPEGSTYKSDVKLIEMPTSTLFLETVENKIDSSFEIRSLLQTYTSASSRIAHKISDCDSAVNSILIAG